MLTQGGSSSRRKRRLPSAEVKLLFTEHAQRKFGASVVTEQSDRTGWCQEKQGRDLPNTETGRQGYMKP